jgi:hypothetical protein
MAPGADEAEQERKRRRIDKNQRRLLKKQHKRALRYGAGAELAGAASDESDASEEALASEEKREAPAPMCTTRKGGKDAKGGGKDAADRGGKGELVDLPEPSARLRAVFEEEVHLRDAGRQLLKVLVAPTSPDAFLGNVLERKPLFVRKQLGGGFQSVFSSALVRSLLEHSRLRYGRDLQLTAQGERGSVDQLEREASGETARSSHVWAAVGGVERCALRLLRPQVHSTTLWKMVACLEALLGCGCAAHAVLTPPGAEVLKAHYDGAGALVLQLEGRSVWTVYNHLKVGKKSKQGDAAAEAGAEEETAAAAAEEEEGDEDQEQDAEELFPRLPLYSSGVLPVSAVKKHLRPAIRATLEAGDLLYVPRGMVHAARALSEPAEASLHVALTLGERNTFSEYIGVALPMALERACENDKLAACAPLREALPRDLYSFMGVVNSDKDADARREAFVAKVGKLIVECVIPEIEFDLAADRMAARFQHDRHHPIGVLGPAAAQQDAPGGGDGEPGSADAAAARLSAAGNKEAARVTIKSAVALRASGVATLTVEGDASILYHACHNGRSPKELEPRGLEFELEDAEALEFIINHEPGRAFPVRSVRHPGGDEDVLRVVRFLVRERVLRRCEA